MIIDNWKIIVLALILALLTTMSIDYFNSVLDKDSLSYVMFGWGIFWIEIIVPFIINRFGGNVND